MHPLYSYARGSCISGPPPGKLRQLSAVAAVERESLMGSQAGYTSDLARRAGGSTGPSGEFHRRSAVGNSFHLPSVALRYALLIAPTGAGALTIDGAPRAPTRPEQLGYVQQYSLNSVFSPAWLAPDHLARSSVEIFDAAMVPSHLFQSIPHAVSSTRETISAMSLDCLQSSCTR